MKAGEFPSVQQAQHVKQPAGGAGQPGTAFIPKPFTSRELVRRVREVLDEAGPAPEAS